MTKRLLTLSFDDGFRDSCSRIAGIYEEFNQKASFNPIGGVGSPGYTVPDEWHNAPYGDWAQWKELAARGHEFNPHSWSHRNHAAMAPAEAQAEVERALAVFEKELPGFRRADAVYMFPYNRGGPEVEAFVSGQCRAFRVGGEPFNPLPDPALKRLGSVTSNSGVCDAEVSYWIGEWLEREPSWLLFAAHGLNQEGWGPMTPDGLRRILDRVLKRPDTAIVTPAAALRAAV
jgi:peptidoglycan/xylan/chitin deacetylase (PgdA/CDA1 family)